MAVKHFSLHKINQTIAVGYKTVHWTNLLNVFVPLSGIVESLKSPVLSGFFFITIKIFLKFCTDKFDCHNFIRREKKGGQRVSFSVILKYVVFIVKKYCSFWLVNLKCSSSNRKRVLPCCQILKKFTEGNLGNKDKKIADKFTKSRFCKIKNCACENYICFYKHHGAPEIEQRRARIKNKNHSSHLKVVRNSFPFSIPAELYERLTRL